MRQIFKLYVGLCLFCFHIGINNVEAQMNPFVTRWNLATTGSGSTQLTFGVATVGTVNYTWQSTTTSASGTGTFTGTTCTISGLPAGETILLSIAPTNFQRIFIDYGNDKSRLMAIEAWGDVTWTSMANAFWGCNNLTTATGNPNLTGVTNMSQIFRDCAIFNGDITAWNTAAVTNMAGVFDGARAFNQDVSGWNTAAVTNMSSMFQAAFAFNQPIGTWHTEKVTNMANMFNSASIFNQNISNWTTSAVTSMGGMFSSAYAFNQDISNWNTEKVTDMNIMFYRAYAFNKSIGTWHTEKVTNMSGMFQYTLVFNQAIGNWNTAAVTDMRYMFYRASAFNQNLGNWTLNANADLGSTFEDTRMDCTNYSATLAAWAAKPGLPTGRSLGAGGRPYGTDVVAARTVLTNSIASGGKGWTITGDVASGVACGSASLPVELLDFKGKNTEGGNLLTWQTASEINNKGFDVERSTSNGDWEALGFVKGKGQASTYQFMDKKPLNQSYYRLRQMDNDDKETFSKVISIEIKGNDNDNKLKAYPNPVSNVLTIETEATGDYQIINILGQIILRGPVSTQQIDVSALSQGNYVLKVGIEQVKFIKQ